MMRLAKPTIVLVAESQTDDFELVVPAGFAIRDIFIQETAGNAITDGLKIGTTSGATDVVVAQTVGANSFDFVPVANILLRLFSPSSNQSLFLQDVTAWNGATIDVVITLDRAIP